MNNIEECKTTYDYLGNEIRSHKKYNYCSAPYGGSTCEILCPFCGKVIKANIRSLSGSGKKCYCGVRHNYSSSSVDNKNIYNGRKL